MLPDASFISSGFVLVELAARLPGVWLMTKQAGARKVGIARKVVLTTGGANEEGASWYITGERTLAYRPLRRHGGCLGLLRLRQT